MLANGLLEKFAVAEDGLLTATCHGSGGEQYSVSAKIPASLGDTKWLLSCTCMAAEKDPVCKHELALLFWRVRELRHAAAAPLKIPRGAAADRSNQQREW